MGAINVFTETTADKQFVGKVTEVKEANSYEDVVKSELRNVPGVIAIGTAVVIGLILNTIVILTNFRKRRKATNMILVSLGIVDLLNCVIITMEIPQMLDILTDSQNENICTVHSFMLYSGDIASAFLVVCVAFDRFAKVSRPHQVVSSKKSIMKIYTCVIFSFILAFPFVIIRAFRFKSECDIRKHRDDTNCESGNNSSCGIVTLNGSGDDVGNIFPLVFYGSLVTVMLSAFVVMVIVYLKLTYMIEVRRRPNRVISTIITPSSADDSVDTAYAADEEDETNISVCASAVRETSLSHLKTISVNRLTTRQNNFYTTLSKIISERSQKINTGVQKNFISGKVLKNDTVSFTSRISDTNLETQNSKMLDPRKSNLTAMRRKSSTLSMATINRLQTPHRTICMLLLSVFVFFLHTPHLCLTILDRLKPSFKTQLSPELQLIYEIIEHSFIWSYILNPILYSFFNRGFGRDFCRLFRCSSQRNSIRRYSSSASRPSKNIASKTRSTATTVKYADVQDYPFLPELQRRLQHI